jgi:hypothetical protein
MIWHAPPLKRLSLLHLRFVGNNNLSRNGGPHGFLASARRMAQSLTTPSQVSVGAENVVDNMSTRSSSVAVAPAFAAPVVSPPQPTVEPTGLVPAVIEPAVRPSPTRKVEPLVIVEAEPSPVEVQPAQAKPTQARSTKINTGPRRSRPRVRRVTRVIRHVDPWSVFKVGMMFSMVLYGILLTAGVLLWQVAYTTGTIDNLEKFFESFGWEKFQFKGGEIYHGAWTGGLFVAVALTGLMVLAATLFNLITDLVGGVRVTVLEEEVVERNPPLSRVLRDRRPTANPDEEAVQPELG